MTGDLFAAEWPPPAANAEAGAPRPEPTGLRKLPQSPQYTAPTREAHPTKWRRVLRAFLEPGARYHRFSAERELRDHVLPSTVAFLQNMGVMFDRTEVCVPGYGGSEVRCMLYWLNDKSRDRARELLGRSA